MVGATVTRYVFDVGLSHSFLRAGLSRRFQSVQYFSEGICYRPYTGGRGLPKAGARVQVRTVLREAFARHRCSPIKEQKRMRRIRRTVVLCLVAVFALSVVAASSASAADLLAQVRGGGSVAGITFLSSSATLPLLHTHSGNEAHCKSVTNHGLFINSTLGHILIRFQGCTFPPGTCKSEGAGAGEIHLLLSTLFHLGLAHLNVEKIPATVILPGKTIKLECGFIPEIKGSVIGALQLATNGNPVPLNTPIAQVNLNFQQTANGLQRLRLFLLPGSTTPTTYSFEDSFELLSIVTDATLDLFLLSNGKHVELELVDP